MPAISAPRARATFASNDSAPKLMSDTKIGISSRRGLSAPGPITSSVPTGSSSSSGTPMQLARSRTACRPSWGARRAPRPSRQGSVMTGAAKARAWQALDQSGAVLPVCRADPGRTPGRLRDRRAGDCPAPRRRFRRASTQTAPSSIHALNWCEPFGVVVFADAGIVAVVPAVDPAVEVVALDPTVGEQGPAMVTAAEEDGDLIIVADDDQVDVGNQGVFWRAVDQLIPLRDGYLLHAFSFFWATTMIDSFAEEDLLGVHLIDHLAKDLGSTSPGPLRASARHGLPAT